jgi:hypothetical protein
MLEHIYHQLRREELPTGMTFSAWCRGKENSSLDCELYETVEDIEMRLNSVRFCLEREVAKLQKTADDYHAMLFEGE